MKAILKSIRPQHTANILNGDKIIEVSSTAPKDWKDYLAGKIKEKPAPREVYIYCTKDDRNGLHWNTHKWVCVNNNTAVLKEICFNGHVVAKFTLNKVEEVQDIFGFIPNETYDQMLERVKTQELPDWYETDSIPDGIVFLEKCCLTKEEIYAYLGRQLGYAWHIDNLVIFDKPKKISEFKVKGFERIKVMGSPYGDLDSVVYHYEKKPKLKSLTHAPQSWCYIEA